MSKTSHYNYRLARLFPANDEYAATIARLCILWEDFFTEASGGAAGSIKQMDGHSPQWRRLYFLRRSIGTVHEIRQALQCLRIQKEFKDALSRQSKAERTNFEESFSKLLKHERLIKTLRDDIGGGHVQHGAVREALNKMDPEMCGMLQQGEHYEDIRFKFAYELVVGTMFPGRGSKDAQKEVEHFLTLMDEATSNALQMIEFAFHVYTKERRIPAL